MRFWLKLIYCLIGFWGSALISMTLAAETPNLIVASPGFEDDTTVNPEHAPLGWKWQERTKCASNQRVSAGEGYQSKISLHLKKTDEKTAAFQRISHPLPEVTLEAGARYRLEFKYRTLESPTGDAGVTLGISSTGGSESANDGTDDYLPDASYVFKNKVTTQPLEWKTQTIDFTPTKKTVAPVLLISQSYWATSPYEFYFDQFSLTKIMEASKGESALLCFDLLNPQEKEDPWEVSLITSSSWSVGRERPQPGEKEGPLFVCDKDFGKGYFEIKRNFLTTIQAKEWLELVGQFSATSDSVDTSPKKSSPSISLWGLWLHDSSGKSALYTPWVQDQVGPFEKIFTILFHYPYPLWNEHPDLDRIHAVTLRFTLPPEAGKFLIRLKSIQAKSIESDLGEARLQADFMERRKAWFKEHPSNYNGFWIGIGSVHQKYGPAYLPPNTEPLPSETIRIASAGNGHAMAQLLAIPSPIAAAQDLSGVVGELTDPETHQSLAISWSLARVTQTTILPLGFETVLAGKYPDPFCHAAVMHLSPQTSHSLWLKGKIPAGTPSGLYRGQLKLQGARSEKSFYLPIELRVWGFNLPLENKIKTNFWISRFPILKWKEKWKMPFSQYAAYLDMILDHRLSPIDVEPEFKFWKEKEDQYTLEINAWQEYVEYCNKKSPGIFNSINLGPNHFLVTYLQNGFTVFDRSTKQELRYDRSHFSKTNQQLFAIYLHTAENWLRQKGLLHNAYLQPVDEPQTDESVPDLKRCMEFIKETKCEAPILLTIPDSVFNERHYEVLQQADLWVPPLIDMPQKYIRDQKKLGHSIWGYECTGGAPLIGGETLTDVRWYWLELWRRKLDGFLFWGVNWWGNTPSPNWETEGVWSGYRKGTNGSESFGDGVLLYPGPSSSLRLEALLEGIEDYHYLWLLRDACDQRKKMPSPPVNLLESAEALLAVGTLQNKVSKDPQAWDQFRSQAADLILKLKITDEQPQKN